MPNQRSTPNLMTSRANAYCDNTRILSKLSGDTQIAPARVKNAPLRTKVFIGLTVLIALIMLSIWLLQRSTPVVTSSLTTTIAKNTDALDPTTALVVTSKPQAAQIEYLPVIEDIDKKSATSQTTAPVKPFATAEIHNRHIPLATEDPGYKPCLVPHDGVANPRDATGYRCGLDLALGENPSFSHPGSSLVGSTEKTTSANQKSSEKNTAKNTAPTPRPPTASEDTDVTLLAALIQSTETASAKKTVPQKTRSIAERLKKCQQLSKKNAGNCHQKICKDKASKDWACQQRRPKMSP